MKFCKIIYLDRTFVPLSEEDILNILKMSL